MFKRTALAAAILLGLAACSDSPMVPEAHVTPLDVSSGGGGAPKSMVCHLDRIDDPNDPEYDGSPGWELLEVNSKSFDKHIDHGDGVPDGQVPDEDMPGYTFDANCGLVPPPVTQCLQYLINAYNAVFTPAVWDFGALGPWTVSLDTWPDFRINGAGFASVSVYDYGDGRTFCEIIDDTSSGVSDTFAAPSQFDATRAYLLSLTQ